MKNIILLFALLILSSCNRGESQSNEKEKETVLSDSINLSTLIANDTLYISARFDECGEWGGHQEILEIFDGKDKKLYLNYKKNTADCNKVEELYNAKLSVVKKIELNNQHQKAINEYMFKLLKSKLREEFPGHSGKEFGILRTDSTFFINVYDNNPENPINYNTLMGNLGLM